MVTYRPATIGELVGIDYVVFARQSQCLMVHAVRQGLRAASCSTFSGLIGERNYDPTHNAGMNLCSMGENLEPGRREVAAKWHPGRLAGVRTSQTGAGWHGISETQASAFADEFYHRQDEWGDLELVSNHQHPIEALVALLLDSELVGLGSE